MTRRRRSRKKLGQRKKAELPIVPKKTKGQNASYHCSCCVKNKAKVLVKFLQSPNLFRWLKDSAPEFSWKTGLGKNVFTSPRSWATKRMESKDYLNSKPKKLWAQEKLTASSLQKSQDQRREPGQAGIPRGKEYLISQEWKKNFLLKDKSKRT